MCLLCIGVVEAEHFKNVTGKGYDAGVYVRPACGVTCKCSKHVYCVEKYVRMLTWLCFGKLSVIDMMDMQGYEIWLFESFGTICRLK